MNALCEVACKDYKEIVDPGLLVAIVLSRISHLLVRYTFEISISKPMQQYALAVRVDILHCLMTFTLYSYLPSAVSTELRPAFGPRSEPVPRLAARRQGFHLYLLLCTEFYTSLDTWKYRLLQLPGRAHIMSRPLISILGDHVQG